MNRCSRCGRCCTYELNRQIKRCRFLIGTIGKKTLCRIYKNRLGTIIDKSNDGKYVVKCIERKDSDNVIPECTLKEN